MTEAEFIDRIWQLWPKAEGTSKEAMDLVIKAVAEFPQSAKLWCMFGDLIQVAPLELPLPAQHPRECYEKAIAIDPGIAEAWASLGFYLDAFDDNHEAAERALRRAIELEPDADAYSVLARVLAEQGRIEDALFLLDSDQCSFASDPRVQETKGEIERGIWKLAES